MPTRRAQEAPGIKSGVSEGIGDQRADALARARHVRALRAQLKRDLKAGRRSIHSLLLDPPEYVETAKVFDFLIASPGFGRVKVNRVLVHCRIPPSKTIGALSERQRSELVTLLLHSPRERSDPPARSTEQRAESLPASETEWEAAIGRLLTWDELVGAVHIPEALLIELRDVGGIIMLATRDGAQRFPEFQLAENAPSKVLAYVHRILVDEGHLSPWSAASWITTPHPDLGGLSPAQWASGDRGDDLLRLTAKRDASRLDN